LRTDNHLTWVDNATVSNKSMRTNKAKIYDKQIDREVEKAVSKFSQHLMSNSKWVRLTETLVENIDAVKKVEFKKVHNDLIGQLYLNEDTTFGFDYWEDGFEGHNSLGGVLSFKEIEYLIFLRAIDFENNIEQDLDRIVKLITNVGQFNLDIDENRLKLTCYKK
jgi:hypothetical protein